MNTNLRRFFIITSTLGILSGCTGITKERIEATLANNQFAQRNIAARDAMATNQTAQQAFAIDERVTVSDFIDEIDSIEMPYAHYDSQQAFDRTLIDNVVNRGNPDMVITLDTNLQYTPYYEEFAPNVAPTMAYWLAADVMHRVKAADSDIGHAFFTSERTLRINKHNAPPVTLPPINYRSEQSMLNMMDALMALGVEDTMLDKFMYVCFGGVYTTYIIPIMDDTFRKKQYEYGQKDLKWRRKSLIYNYPEHCEKQKASLIANGQYLYTSDDIKGALKKVGVEKTIVLSNPDLHLDFYRHLSNPNLFAGHDKTRARGMFRELVYPQGNRLLMGLPSKGYLDTRDLSIQSIRHKGLRTRYEENYIVARYWFGDANGYQNFVLPKRVRFRLGDLHNNNRRVRPIFKNCIFDRKTRSVYISANDFKETFICNGKLQYTDKDADLLYKRERLHLNAQLFGFSASMGIHQSTPMYDRMSHIALIEFPVFNKNIGLQITSEKNALANRRVNPTGDPSRDKFYRQQSVIPIGTYVEDVLLPESEWNAVIAYVDQRPDGEIIGVVHFRGLKVIYHLTDLAKWYQTRIYPKSHGAKQGLNDWNTVGGFLN